MLYILRPLIYALLVQQIDAQRAKNNASTTATTTTADTNTSANTATTGGVGTLVATTGSSVTGVTGAAGVISRVLDVFSMDALLNVLALVVSFVSLSFSHSCAAWYIFAFLPALYTCQPSKSAVYLCPMFKNNFYSNHWQ